MDYEKAYKEALNWMRSIYPTLTGSDKEDAEHYFPELAESEDERTRKEIMNFILHKAGALIDEDTEHRYIAYLEKQKEQKPNIELIQRSWYMEGYHDREFNKEPKWIIKTGEGGPRYEENPKYGQHIEQKPVERSLEDDHIIGFVYDLLNEIEWKDDWAMSKEECLRLLSNYSPQKPAEWSEDDERNLKHCIDIVRGWEVDYYDANPQYSNWLKSLPERLNLPLKQEWSEEDETIIEGACNALEIYGHTKLANKLKSLRPSWKPSEEQKEPEYYQHFDPDC